MFSYGTILLYIAVAIIFFICWGTYRLVVPITDKIFKEKNTNDQRVQDVRKNKKKNLNNILSISKRYEMIQENPLEYPESIREIITKNYKNVLLGTITDPDTIHAPKERDSSGDYINKDYIRYLKNQARKLGENSWHHEEYLRVKELVVEENIGLDFKINILRKGVEPSLVHSMVSVKRMEEYSVEDWDELIRAVKNYYDIANAGFIISFLENIEDREILLNREKFELYILLLSKDIPEKVASVFLRTNMTNDEIILILELIDKEYPLNDAITLVLTDKKNKYEANLARMKMEALLK